MLFRVLGPLQVESDAGVVVPGGARSRALLTALLLDPGALVPLDRLAEAVWPGEPPADVGNGVHTTVSRLRRALGPVGTLVRTRPPGYLLDVGRDAVDAELFEAGVREATARLATDPAAAAGTLERVLALWRGPAYGEFADGFARAAATRLDALRTTALEARADAVLRAGDPATAAALAADLTAEHPLRERPVEIAMRALAALGRTPEALEAFRRHRALVGEELGLDPSPTLRALETRLLRADVVAPRPDPARPDPGLPTRPSPLVGRADELRDLTGALAERRLVTVVGPGGVGKTRCETR